jgi:putative sterol carrier protein
MKPSALALAAVAALSSALPAAAETAMAPAWAQALCTAWNADPVLTSKLVETGWVRNDAGRGFKAMQVWRADCAGSSRAELRIALKDDKAMCVFGGAAETKDLNGSADYRMWADTARWREMGAGEYGPMRAMLLGRLNFDGPQLEAMGNMGPFESFLLLVGKVPGDWSSCPATAKAS